MATSWVRRLIWPRSPSASYVSVPESARDHAKRTHASPPRPRFHRHRQLGPSPTRLSGRGARGNKCYQLCLCSALDRAKDVVPRGGNCPEAIQPPHTSADREQRATNLRPRREFCRASSNYRSVRARSIFELSDRNSPTALYRELWMVFLLKTRGDLSS